MFLGPPVRVPAPATPSTPRAARVPGSQPTVNAAIPPLCQKVVATFNRLHPGMSVGELCEKGQLTQRPPIPYATPKAETILKASRETIKMKTPEGDVKTAVLGDNPGAEEYLQHINSFLRMLSACYPKL